MRIPMSPVSSVLLPAPGSLYQRAGCLTIQLCHCGGRARSVPWGGPWPRTDRQWGWGGSLPLLVLFPPPPVELVVEFPGALANTAHSVGSPSLPLLLGTLPKTPPSGLMRQRGNASECGGTWSLEEGQPGQGGRGAGTPLLSSPAPWSAAGAAHWQEWVSATFYAQGTSNGLPRFQGWGKRLQGEG